MFCCAVLIRTYALVIIFVQGKTYRGWRYYLLLVILFVGLVVFGTVSQLVPGRLTILYLDFFETCHYVYAYRYSCIALVFAMWVLEAVVVWRASLQCMRKWRVACSALPSRYLYSKSQTRDSVCHIYTILSTMAKVWSLRIRQLKASTSPMFGIFTQV
ncbi:hypothetical protein DL89DRAFT_322104, partial [Linderina pennispora]